MREIEKLKYKVAELQNKLEKAEKVLEENYYLSDAAVHNPYMFTLPEKRYARQNSEDTN